MSSTTTLAAEIEAFTAVRKALRTARSGAWYIAAGSFLLAVGFFGAGRPIWWFLVPAASVGLIYWVARALSVTPFNSHASVGEVRDGVPLNALYQTHPALLGDTEADPEIAAILTPGGRLTEGHIEIYRQQVALGA